MPPAPDAPTPLPGSGTDDRGPARPAAGAAPFGPVGRPAPVGPVTPVAEATG
jgi:hypothetical protein